MVHYNTISANHILGRLKEGSPWPFLLADQDRNCGLVKNPFSGNDRLEILWKAFLSIISKNFPVAALNQIIIQQAPDLVIRAGLNYKEQNSIQQFLHHELLVSCCLEGSSALNPAALDHRQVSPISSYILFVIPAECREKNPNLIITDRDNDHTDCRFLLLFKSISKCREMNCSDDIVLSFIMNPSPPYRKERESKNSTTIRKSIQLSKNEIHEINQTLLNREYFSNRSEL